MISNVTGQITVHCLSTWCLPQLCKSQTPGFSTEPKTCHIYMTQKSLTLKCIRPNGTPFLAKTFAGICHSFYSPSSNSISGSRWCLTLELWPKCLLSHLLQICSRCLEEVPSAPSTPHLLSITSFLLYPTTIIFPTSKKFL